MHRRVSPGCKAGIASEYWLFYRTKPELGECIHLLIVG